MAVCSKFLLKKSMQKSEKMEDFLRKLTCIIAQIFNHPSNSGT